jgi:hypothetical protein
LIDEEELGKKHHCDKEPPQGDQYAKDFESFKETRYGQQGNYGSDFDESIRILENYKNIRELK